MNAKNVIEHVGESPRGRPKQAPCQPHRGAETRVAGAPLGHTANPGARAVAQGGKDLPVRHGPRQSPPLAGSAISQASDAMPIRWGCRARLVHWHAACLLCSMEETPST